MFPRLHAHVTHLGILGTPIGDYLYCTGFFAMKRVVELLFKLEDVSAIDALVAFNLLRAFVRWCT